MNKHKLWHPLFLFLLSLLLVSCQRTASPLNSALLTSEQERRKCLALFESCERLAQPLLPGKWRAVALMAPFLAPKNTSLPINPTRQLVLADIIFDDRAGAQLSQSFSAIDGAPLEILLATRVSGRSQADVYRLTQSSGLIQCRKAQDNDHRFKSWLAPSTSWFVGTSDTLGVAPIRDIANRRRLANPNSKTKRLPSVNVEWWQTEIDFNGITGTNWLWFDEAKRWPYRTMMINSAAEKKVPLIGDYSMSYFLQFEELQQTDLQALRSFCESQQTEISSVLLTEKATRDFVLINGEKSLHQLPSFPESFTATALMTPINYRFHPFPTIIKYDAPNSRIFTELYSAPDINDPPQLPEIAALLFKDHGRITTCEGDDAGVQRVTLGAPGPDWMRDGGCNIAIVMQRPGFEDTLAIRCPVKESPTETRLFWMWYSANGEPLTFMESNAHLGVGTSLSLADYRDWKRKKVNIGDHADRDYCETQLPIYDPIDMPAGCYGCHGGKPATLENKS